MKKIFEKMVHLGIIDHPKITQNKIIIEPYTATIDDFEELSSFCRKNGLEFGVRGDSEHYPGHTFRIEIVRKNGLWNITS